MIKTKKILILYFFLSFIGHAFAITDTDSLLNTFRHLPNDSNKALSLNKTAVKFLKIDLSASLKLVNESNIISKSINNKPIQAKSLELKGKVLRKLSRNSESIKYYKAAFEIYEQLDHSLAAAKVLNSIGACYYYLNDLSTALSYFKASAELRAKVNDSIGIAKTYNNVGEIYRQLKEFNKALEYHKRSYSIKIELKDTLGIISSIENIGNVNYDLDSIHKALETYRSAFTYSNETLSFFPGIYYGISRCYSALNNTDSCITYINKAIFIAEKIDNSFLKKLYYLALGDFQLEISEFDKAKNNYEKSLRICKEQNLISEERYIQLSLSKLYEKTNKFKRSLNAHKRFYYINDSLRSADHAKKIRESELRSDFKIKTEIRELEIAQKEFKQLLINLALFIGAIISVLALLYVNRTRKVIEKKNSRLEKQKLKIENQNKDLEVLNKSLTEKTTHITSSINYAKKIQQAILASDDYINKTIKNSFLLFLPRDIVSGDFYWLHKSLENKIYLCVADCTGHGIPGAFMSMIGNSLLNELIIERKISRPDEVLNEMKRQIILSLKQKGIEGEARDGMDMTLCEIDKEKQMLRFSGANNPIYIIRNKELIEIKGDPQPVGFLTNEDPPFTLHEFKLITGDLIYMFSDGFPDQFGGPRGKKFMYKPFKRLLLNMQNTPINDQCDILKKELLDWMGKEPQVDDICVLGYEFKPDK